MPIYEYRCNQCSRTFSVFVRTVTADITALCPRCQSQDVRRIISRFAVVRSEESRTENLLDMAESAGDLDENDPRSLARWARRMSSELGEDAGPEFNELVDRLEAGESPESIEKSLGDVPEPTVSPSEVGEGEE